MLHRWSLVLSAAIFLSVPIGWSQSKLSVHWEELTAADFRSGIHQAEGTCLLPFGILEKHGPHLPLGTDLLNVRYAALHARSRSMRWCFRNIILDRFLRLNTNPGPSPTARRYRC